METDRHYLMVGSFVLLTVLAIILFSAWLVGAYDDSKYRTYRIRFAESVSGLDVGGHVKFRGVKVGKVQSMMIDPVDTRLIRVDVGILKGTPIKTDTVATLKMQGVTGDVYIELSGTTPQAPDLLSNDGRPPEIPAQPGTLSALMDMLPEIVQKLSHIAAQADKLFSDRNVTAFNDMLENLQKIARDIGQIAHGLKENPSKIIIPPKEKGIPAP